MSARVARFARFAIELALILLISGPALAASRDDESRAAVERALRAQIDRMDQDLQVIESQMYRLEHDHAADPARADKQSALHAQIERMDHEQDLLKDRLHQLEKQDSPAVQEARRQAEIAAEDKFEAEHPPAPDTAPAPAQAPAPVPEPVPVPVQIASPPAPPPPAPPPQLGPTLRQAADPAPYEKAAGGYVGMFHYNPYRWVPVGTRQVAVYNTYDDAYLLDLAIDCPGLLSADRIKIENFSTKVVMNRDAVIADGQHCLITGIRQLNTVRLPR